MTIREFNKFVQEKYTEPDGVHHYEDSDGDVVSITTDYPVSNYTYEERINDKKNKIKLLKPEYIESFVEEFKSLL
jgi:prophage tail gpP-like protein